jgi:hypothetical protein
MNRVGSTMRKLTIGILVLVSTLTVPLLRTIAAAADPDCDQVAAKMEEAGGSKSVDEIATQLHIAPERVKQCMARIDAPKPAKSPQAEGVKK